MPVYSKALTGLLTSRIGLCHKYSLSNNIEHLNIQYCNSFSHIQYTECNYNSEIEAALQVITQCTPFCTLKPLHFLPSIISTFIFTINRSYVHNL